MKASIGRVPFIMGKGMPQGYKTVTKRELRQRKIERIERAIVAAIAAQDIDLVVKLTHNLNQIKGA